MFGRLRRWAGALQRDVLALWFAYRDPRTPRIAKLLAMLIVGYALSPIDLIPDFVPVLGYLDELLLLPGAIYLAVRLVPEPVMRDSRARAAAWVDARNAAPRSYLAAAIIVLIWLGLAWLAWRLAAP
jgi:uncharacterized membrane protein YkvA (DUF1232 family)